MPISITEYRSCVLIAAILGHIQKLHLAVNGWFMQRQSQIYMVQIFPDISTIIMLIQ